MRIGERIKMIREDKGIDLDELSAMTGISPSVLLQIENHMESPSLGMLLKLSKALDVPLSAFFGEEEGQDFTIVRKDERKQVARYGSEDGSFYGYTYESLGYGMANRHMEPFIVTIEPTTQKETPSVHEGEEFIYVLEGEMEIQLGEFKDVLHPGDSIYYKAKIPHLVRAHGDSPLKILAVLYGKD